MAIERGKEIKFNIKLSTISKSGHNETTVNIQVNTLNIIRKNNNKNNSKQYNKPQQS